MTPEQEVKHLREADHAQLCTYLASKIRRARKQRRESQIRFAERAGIALRTYKRLETHGQGHLETLLKALVALDRVQYLHMLFPAEQTPKVLSLTDRIEAIRTRQG